MSPLFVRPGPEAEYFGSTCEAVLDPWFQERGFALVTALSTPTLRVWRKDKCFVEFNYWPEDTPEFPVMVGLGFITDLPFGFFGPRKPMRQGLGLWEAVSAENDRVILAESFRNRAELESLLVRIRERTLIYAEALLADEKAMKLAIKNRQRVP
jgi:hypothetical protein